MKLFFETKGQSFLHSFGNNFIKLSVLIIFLTTITNGQSSDQNLPTPISTNQLTGEIKARDIGDSRLTTYYFVFGGDRGDIFINVVTSNLNGDIDIFSADGLKPKTKITLYADSSENETGRVIYLRQPEKLILRIQGRSPNDDAAKFQLKFAGSFEPSQAIAGDDVSVSPKATASNNAKVKVNSVGTIIEEPAKPTPVISDPVAVGKIDKVVSEKDKADGKNVKKVDKIAVKRDETDSENSQVTSDSNSDTRAIPSTFDPTKKVEDILKENRDEKPRLIFSDPFNADKKKDDVKLVTVEDDETPETELTLDLNDKPKNVSAIVRIEIIEEGDDTPDEVVSETANPLAKIFLKVELKNGDKFERSMAEVLSMNVIKGVLTIVTNDGKIQEYSILDVVKMTIE